jgi:hypothetical protein
VTVLASLRRLVPLLLVVLLVLVVLSGLGELDAPAGWTWD